MDTAEQRAAEGRRIARARSDHRWSQGELARRARVAPNTLAKIENGGTAQAGKVAAVREALGLEPPALVSEGPVAGLDGPSYPPDVQIIRDAVGIWLLAMPAAQRAQSVAHLLRAITAPG